MLFWWFSLPKRPHFHQNFDTFSGPSTGSPKKRLLHVLATFWTPFWNLKIAHQFNKGVPESKKRAKGVMFNIRGGFPLCGPSREPSWMDLGWILNWFLGDPAEGPENLSKDWWEYSRFGKENHQFHPGISLIFWKSAVSEKYLQNDAKRSPRSLPKRQLSV